MPRTKLVRVRDLPEHTLPERGGPFAGCFLFCPACGRRYSATRGDYFLKLPHEVLYCYCESTMGRRTPLRLAREQVKIILVK